MPSQCQTSERLWGALLKDVAAYDAVIQKQFSLIRKRNLGYPTFEPDIKAARRHFGMAKIAVINHHKIHGC